MDAIFVDQQDGVFLVLNWRARARTGGHARLVRLSPTHLVRYQEMRRLGRTPLGIYHLLFLPRVAIVALLATSLPLAAETGSGAAPPHGPATEPGPPSTQKPAPTGPLPATGLGRSGTGWAISAGVHALTLLTLCFLCYAVHPDEVPVAPLRTAAPADPAEAPAPPTDASAVDAKNLTEVQVSDTSEIDLPVLDPEMQTDAASLDEPTSLHPLPARSSALDSVPDRIPVGLLGVGQGAEGGGMPGPRGGQRRRAALRRYGGTAAGQNAVEAALRWFKRHQDPSGCWSVGSYERNCPSVPKCEPVNVLDGDHSFTCAMTGCALLCFLGAGYDQVGMSTYREVVRKGIRYLAAAQRGDGSFGNNNYTNAIATMALAEASALSPDRRLQDTVRRASRLLIRRQNRAGDDADLGGNAGWDYIGPDQRNDSSVSGWCVMALVSARRAGIDVGSSLERATRWLDVTWRCKNPSWQGLDVEQGVAEFPYTFTSEANMTVGGEPTTGGLDLAGVGAVTAAFLPHPGSDTELATLGRHILATHLPQDGSFNRYYVYYGSLALFQEVGKAWSNWNTAMQKTLIASQRRGPDCFAGSWDDGRGGFCRLFSTALCCLSLEVYYRYDRVRVDAP